jgi:hypothetical protein
LGAVALAQDIEPVTPPTGTENVAIVYPVPVLTLSGEVTIAGSAAAQGMSNYFVEFRPLILPVGEGTPTPVEGAWFPATLPSTTPVSGGALGTWNTETAPDGLYEIRLVVIAGGQAQYFRVSPLRVLNNPEALSPFAGSTNNGGGFAQGAEATQAALATLFAFQNNATPSGGNTFATPVPTTGGPRVIAQTSANVRTGDSTAYPTVGSLLTGASAPIQGISSTGTGWYYIQLESGRRGFISPSTVRVEGSVVGLPIINPPPVPATPTPVATATPVTSADLLLSGMRAEPNPPVCLQAFNVFINAVNNGTGPTTSNANVQLIDRHVASGTVTTSNIGVVPPLAAGQNFVIVIPLNVGTFFNEGHELTATINYDGLTAETNTSNNTFRLAYTLAQGGC